MMLMLCVTTLTDPITARAKMDLMEAEQTALVIDCNTVCFNAEAIQERVILSDIRCLTHELSESRFLSKRKVS